MSFYFRMAALFVVLTGMIMLVGYAIGYLLGEPLLFLSLAVVTAVAVNFYSYYESDKLVIRMSKAKIIQESDNPTLYSAVRTVAQKAGIPMPKVGIVNSPQPNAFATGRGPDRAVVVATTGILGALTPDELQAVIGHEIGHVVHRDVLMSSIAASMAGAISYIVLFSMMFGGGYGGNGRGGGGGLVALAAIFLVPLGAMFVRLGISRSVEYNADEYGAKLTHNPASLSSALQKISSMAKARPVSSNGPNAPSPATASLWIVNPFRGSSVTELFSTHPSTEHRIQRLRKIGEEIGVYVP